MAEEMKNLIDLRTLQNSKEVSIEQDLRETEILSMYAEKISALCRSQIRMNEPWDSDNNIDWSRLVIVMDGVVEKLEIYHKILERFL